MANNARLHPSRSDSREGSILLSAVLLTFLLLGFIAASVMISNAEARAVSESEEMNAAFFFAEAGVEAAKREINEGTDPDANGIGTISLTDYKATSESIGTHLWKVTSVGVFRSRSVTLEVVVEKVRRSKFAGGAISMIGAFDKSRVQIMPHAGIIIDGSGSSAITLQDQSLYESIGEGFANAFRNGDMPAINLSGSETDTFAITQGTELGESIDLPILIESDPPNDMTNMTALYNDLVNGVNNTILPSATIVTDFTNDNTVFGTETNPEVVYLADIKTRSTGQSISGYGTLIVNELTLEQGATLDWHGDVYVIGRVDHRARVTVRDDSSFNIDGNFVIIGEGSEDVEVRIDNADVTVNGSLFLGTDYGDANGQKSATLDVESGGSLEVNGVTTLIGATVGTTVKDGGDLLINGTLQVAGPEDTKNSNVTLDFRGNVEVYKDDDQIESALDGWSNVSTAINSPTPEIIIDYEMETQSWTQPPL